MIAYLKGIFSHKSPTEVFIETQGIGYRVFISLQTYEKIKDLKNGVLFIRMVVKNENQNVSAFQLYGFYEESERDLFEKLLSVSGVGSSTALMMLSTYPSAEIIHAIQNKDVDIIKRVKGIGPKSAERIILELKDKLSGLPQFEDQKGVINIAIREEALAALISLGFNKNSCMKIINEVLTTNPNINRVEELIKLSLKQL